MLTKELTIAEYDFVRARVIPDRLTQRKHAHYLPYAARMLHVYRSGIGRTRRELHRRVHDVWANETDCPLRRIDAFCKLLDDASTYRRDPRGEAAALRRQVFRMAAAWHPLVRQPVRWFESREATVKGAIAQQLGRRWDEIDRDLFADVIEFHRLQAFAGYGTPEDLLARYNVAQFQAVLFRAQRLTVWANRDFKTILGYAKLARLMHTITRQLDGRYCLHLDGPASVLRQTRRYGAAMARFLPGLLACRDWRLHASIPTRRSGWRLNLDLTSEDGLHSAASPPEAFDSNLEATFARTWGTEAREGWHLLRESEILHRGQKVFVPDFTFQHTDGRSVLMEIVGYWTPEYLQSKAETLRTFRHVTLLLAIGHSAKDAIPDLGFPTIVFKSTLRVQEVLDALAQVPAHRGPPRGGRGGRPC